jgi:steroid 5-alpha reductase family enzyme
MAEALEPVSPLVKRIADLNRHLKRDFLGGPRPFKMAWVINAQKATTIVFVAGLMLACRNGSTVAWVYLALHGTYGLCWLLKHFAFPDRRWEAHVTMAGAVMTWVLVLGLYWVIAFLVVSDVLGPRPEPPPAMLAVAIGVHTLGVALMTAADAQKYFTLRVHPGLIEDGLFRLVRHPNYLGEMMIYGAYALLARHWIAWAILAWVWTSVFFVNMKVIDASLSRHPGWAAYKARTGMILPRLGAPARHAPQVLPAR